MNNHRKSISILSAVAQSHDPCQSRHKAIEPSPSEKTLEIGADLVRQIFCYFEPDFRVSGIHLNDAG
jgi:hypothetical protein